MKTNLKHLNEHLFDALERLNDPALKSADEIKAEISRAKAVSDVGKTIIEGGRLMIEATELRLSYTGSSITLPKLLQSEDNAG